MCVYGYELYKCESKPAFDNHLYNGVLKTGVTSFCFQKLSKDKHHLLKWHNRKSHIIYVLKPLKNNVYPKQFPFLEWVCHIAFQKVVWCLFVSSTASDANANVHSLADFVLQNKKKRHSVFFSNKTKKKLYKHTQKPDFYFISFCNYLKIWPHFGSVFLGF